MEPLKRNKQNPIPFVDKNEFNSLLFLARLLRTNDHLTPKDICSLQQVEPHFKQIMQNINKNESFIMDKNGILFKKIKKRININIYIIMSSEPVCCLDHKFLPRGSWTPCSKTSHAPTL